MLRKSIIAAGIAAICSGLLSIPADARSVDRFRLGGWVGDAYVDDANNRFSSCVASAQYRSGIAMSVQVDGNYNWFIGFSSSSWNMTVGQNIPLQYRIDRGAWQQANGEVRTATMVRIQMPANGSLVYHFRRGRLLQVFDGNNTYEFRLTGTSKLMARLGRCVQINSARFGLASTPSAPAPGTSAPSQPGGAQPGGSQTAPANSALQVEATQALFNLMTQAGLSGLKLIPDQDREDSLKGLYAVAMKDGRTVVAHIFEPGGYASEQDLMAQIIADSAKTCEGSFQSGTEQTSEGGKQLFTSYAHCTSGDTDLVERVAIVPRTAGGIFVYGVSDTYTGTADSPTASPPELTDPDFYRAAAEAAN